MAEPARRVCNDRLDRAPHARQHQLTRTRFIFSIALTAAVALPMLWAAPAQAQDSPAEIEAKIDQAWRELEPIIEEYNAVRIELKERQQEIDKLADRIEPLALQVDLARAEVTDVAVYSFKSGNVSAFRALLSSGSPHTFADQLTVLDQFAKSQRVKISKVIDAKERYEAEKVELDALVVELAENEEQLASRADEIDAEIDRLQDLRAAAYGSSGGVGDLSPAPCPTHYPGGAAGEVVSFACNQIGKPYGWGSAGPDTYDCSGLMKTAWAQAGVYLPHNAAQQRNAIRYVNRGELRPGDLVFYYGSLSHVGMYVGDGWIVHASQAGVPVRMSPIDQMPINSYGRPG